MSKIELSLTSDYVPNWTIVDAVRELFQNALDQQVQYPDNTASWSYDGETLKVRNKRSVLPVRSLLLGASTKAGSESTIGQFGEGYKIATLVLLRNDKTITIYNYGAKEVWRPRFVKSRRFGADILTFFIEKYIWTTPPSDDLIIEVGGISQTEYRNLIKPSNLHLQENYTVLHDTEYGEILDLQGLVFVNGLFVCKYDSYTYGYNFKPGQLKLDRDRKLASDFDLKWLASKLWSKCDGALDLVETGAADVAYLADNYCFFNSQLADDAWDRFTEVHGLNAVPVTSQEEADAVPQGRRAVIVNNVFARLIKSSKVYAEPEPLATATIEDLLMDWFETYKDSLDTDAQASFLDIVEKVRTANQRSLNFSSCSLTRSIAFPLCLLPKRFNPAASRISYNLLILSSSARSALVGAFFRIKFLRLVSIFSQELQ